MGPFLALQVRLVRRTSRAGDAYEQIVQTHRLEELPRSVRQIRKPDLTVLGVGDSLSCQYHRKFSYIMYLRPKEIDNEIHRLGGFEGCSR